MIDNDIIEVLRKSAPALRRNWMSTGVAAGPPAKPRVGAWGDQGRGPSHGSRGADGAPRVSRGTAPSCASPSYQPADAAGGRWAQSAPEPRSCVGLRVGSVGGPDDTGRSDVALTLDLQEHPQIGQSPRGAGHQVGHTTVAQLLADLDYSLQGTRKTLKGTAHPDRDAQFRYINRCVKVFQRAGQPVISVDAKKKDSWARLPMGAGTLSPRGSQNASRRTIFRIRHWARFVRMACTIRPIITAG